MDNLPLNNKKTFLSSLAIKIILAIIIFAGSSIIIISGIKFIVEYYKTPNYQTNNQTTKLSNQQSQNYYDLLKEKCKNNNSPTGYILVCLLSIQYMEENNYKEADENEGCPDGFEINLFKKGPSLAWCEPIENKNCLKEGERSDKIRDKCCGKSEFFADGDYISEIKACVASQNSICLNCGNGICGTGENRCNCPKDCGEEINVSDLSSEASVTDDWQTYQNEEYGFEIEIPNTWPKFNIRKRFIKGSTVFLEIGFLTNNSNLSKQDGYFYIYGINVFTKDQYENYFLSDGTKPRIFAQNQIYVFTKSMGQDICECEDLIEPWKGHKKIFDTFKFIEKDNTFDFQTYTDSKYGFSLKHPKNWECKIDVDQNPSLKAADRIILCKQTDRNKTGTNPTIHINIMTIFNETNPAEWLENNYGIPDNVPKTLNYEVAGTRGIKYSHTEGNPPTIPENEGIKLVFIKNNKLFYIYCHIDEEGEQKNNIENILKSIIVN